MHGSFFSLDWSDADIVFTDSVMFSQETMAELSRRGAALKQGARIISKKPFEGDDYAPMGQLVLNVSWSKSTLAFQLQTKVTPANRSAFSDALPALRSCCVGPCDAPKAKGSRAVSK